LAEVIKRKHLQNALENVLFLFYSYTVAYLGGMVRCSPFGRPWKFFTGDFIWKGAFFAVFQQISEKNGRICGFHWTFKSKKCFSFRPPL